MTVHFHVTADDIRRGRRRNPGKCPVAIAATRRLGRPCDVGPDTLEWSTRVWDRVCLPPDVVHKIALFDHGGRAWMKPFRFKLNLPSGVIPV